MKIMKSIILSTIIFISFCVNSSAQSTERFIRIIGNAKTESVADKLMIVLSLSEVEPNEYRKIPYRSYDEVYKEFVQNIEGLGYLEKNLTPIFAQSKKYQKTRTESYNLLIEAKDYGEISDLKIEGFKLTSSKYYHSSNDDSIEESLALEAIRDAERKAKSLCDKIDKKLGKILNIEDTSSGCCNNLGEQKKQVISKAYKVTITFELLD